MTDNRIVTSTYRYKRPPRKRKPLVDVPAIITVPDRRLEKWERLTRGSSGSSDGDPETLDAWARALLAGKLRPGK
jgi:hypothetical protein